MDTSSGNDSLLGGIGNDTLDGGTGIDFLDGGFGEDTVVFSEAPGLLKIHSTGSAFLPAMTVDITGVGTETVLGMERIRTADGEVIIRGDLGGLFAVSLAGDNFFLLGTAYTGPVAGLQRQLLGTAAGEVFGGTAGHDFMNLLGGDDAANGGAGNDVIDGGLGSNFLTGGAGQDVFFSDGRSGGVTWTTITDWGAGEQLSLFGWRPGVSRSTWVDSDGTAGFRGATMHGDLNGDGVIDTSVTWANQTRANLPVPLEFDNLLWFIG